MIKTKALGLKLLSYANFSFLSLFVVAVLYAGLFPVQNKFGLFGSPIPIFIASVALIAVLAWLMELDLKHIASRYFKKLNIRKNYAKVIIAGFALSFLVQVIVAHALRSYGYDWDSELVLNQAVNYAVNGSIDPSAASYFAINPNNIALLSSLGGWFKILHAIGVHDLLSAAIGLNVFLMTLTQILIFLTVKLLYGRRIAAISMLFSFVFISLTMYVQIPYTDSLTIIFPVLLLYIYLHITQSTSFTTKVLLSVSLGLTAIVGYLIKPTVILAFVVVAAISFVGFVSTNSLRTFNRDYRKWLRAIVCTAACLGSIGLTYIAYPKAVDSLQIVPFPVSGTSETSKPLVHFIAMGMMTTHYNNMTNYGGYNDKEASEVANLLTKEQKTDYSINHIQQRLTDYGPFGYVNFLAHKANWILSDSTFYAYGEGSNEKVIFTSQDPFSRFIRSFMYIGGAWYILFGNILQVFWVAILLLVASQLIILSMNKSSRIKVYTMMPRLMIAAILLFLLLFEGRSRYIFLYLPIFIIAAMHTLYWFKQADEA